MIKNQKLLVSKDHKYYPNREVYFQFYASPEDNKNKFIVVSFRPDLENEPAMRMLS